MRGGLAAAAALLAALACEEAPPRRAAPTAPLATLVLEPPRIGVGDVAVLELAVVTPPGHVPRAFQPPEPQELAGFWLLDAERLETEKQPGRWVHRTRLRLRARAVGDFTWPPGAVEVETPDGSLVTLEVPSLPLEVVSVGSDHPERLHPFGARGLPTPQGSAAGLAAAAAVGALTTLAAVGLAARARRRRASGTPALPAPAAQPDPPWIVARAELAAAAARGDADPLAAAHRVAAALRRYMARRFHADALGRTTEELALAEPPFAATSRWPILLDILRGLDAFRFRPVGGATERAQLADRLADLCRRAEDLVEDSVPPQERT